MYQTGALNQLRHIRIKKIVESTGIEPMLSVLQTDALPTELQFQFLIKIEMKIKMKNYYRENNNVKQF